MMENVSKFLCLLITIIAFNSTSRADNVIQLIGLENDTSSLSKESYSVMYDQSDSIPYQRIFAPYQTIAILRKGDDVKLMERNFLVVPTADGFKYITQSVGESPIDTTGADNEFDFLIKYEIQSTTSQPKILNDQASVKKLIASTKPTFKDAIYIDYEKLSFVTPNFYITEGFNSEVHGGATWFNAEEVCNLYKLNPKLSISSTHLHDYLDKIHLTDIIIDAVKEVDYNIGETKIDENYLLPWDSPIKEHEGVFFTLDYTHNQATIVPLTSLHGNSARSFFVRGKYFFDTRLISTLKIKNPDPSNKELEFVSPDKNTRIFIDKDVGSVKVYNTTDNRLLLEATFPKFNKVIMSEWANEKYIDSWTHEFE